MRKFRVVILSLALSVFTAQSAFADNPFDKLGRGLTNILTCAGELAGHATKQNNQHPPISGFIRTLIFGSYYTVIRFTAGVYETATFLIPIPWKYETVIHPETLA